jgi:hypothetical protein
MLYGGASSVNPHSSFEEQMIQVGQGMTLGVLVGGPIGLAWPISLPILGFMQLIKPRTYSK